MLFCKLRKVGFVAVWMLMAGLAACAAGPQTELSETAASRILSVALLDIAEPPVDLIVNRGSSNESHSSTYAQALTDAQVEFSPLLAEAITRQLERSNYRIVNLPTQRPVIDSDGRLDLSTIATDADAILVVRFKGAGYVSSSSSALQPWAVVDVQLFDTRTRTALYSRTFNGGDELGLAGAMHLATNARYQYASPDELITKLDDSVDGIKDAELAIGAAIGQVFAIGTRPVAGYVEQAPPPAVVAEKSAAERDREAAAAMAAQWAAAAPPPTPAVEETAASSNDDAPVAAAEAPSSATATATPDAEAPLTAPAVMEPGAESSAVQAAPSADDEAVVADTPQVAAPDEAAEPAEPTEPAEPIESTDATAPQATPPISPAATITTPAAADNDVAGEVANDAHEVIVPEAAPAPAPAAVIETSPPTPAIPSPAPAIAPAPSVTPNPVLKQRTPVRVSPTLGAKVFAILPAGTSFTRRARVIRNAGGAWCYIDAGDIGGWVSIEAAQP